MKKRRGHLLWETGVCLLILVATSGSLAMLVQAIASGRLATRSFIAERLLIESTAEEFLAIDFDNLESYAGKLSGEGSIQVSLSERQLGNVTGKQIQLQSARYRRLTLSLWRFPKPNASAAQPVTDDVEGADANESKTEEPVSGKEKDNV